MECIPRSHSTGKTKSAVDGPRIRPLILSATTHEIRKVKFINHNPGLEGGPVARLPSPAMAPAEGAALVLEIGTEAGVAEEGEVAEALGEGEAGPRAHLSPGKNFS